MILENTEQSLKKINDFPSISDNVLIRLMCPDSTGCLTSDPLKLNNFTIYYVNRNYSNNSTKYNKNTYDEGIKTKLDLAIKNACINPSLDNLEKVEKLRLDYNNSLNVSTFYYSDAISVLSIGNDEEAAWDQNYTSNSLVKHITKDENDEDVFGVFEYIWQPFDMREGDYFICWTWTPNSSGSKLSDHFHFNLAGSTLLTTSIPTHFTDKTKYETLLDRYTPEMFKLKMSPKDMTPETIQELNRSVAKGFTFLEDFANQIVDLNDANSTHESFLPLLGNLFGIKLRTNDPTLWRRQIKEAVKLSKKKGTYDGLKEALLQAGISLNKYTKLWQVSSKYTYQQMFNYEGENSFSLDRISFDIENDNFELYLRKYNSNEWELIDLSNIELDIDENGNQKILNWIGEDLEINDSIRFVYKIKEIPSEDEQTIESYVRLLPLMDNRDERDQDYPIKNWNIRLIEEDDVIFDSIINDKHPFFEDVIYGKIRTEFPYSENIYNMDEYNGSIRDSTLPCDIDKDFIDICHSCLSSKFSVDLEIEDISTNRILEALDIIKEYTPVHAMLHSLNLSGSINEFVKPQLEKIEALIKYVQNEFTVAGNAQTSFNRSMELSSLIKRNELANVSTVASNVSCTGVNEKVELYCPSLNFNDLPITSNSSYKFIEISNTSLNQGKYSIGNVNYNKIEVTEDIDNIVTPLNKSAFSFDLYNIIAEKNSIIINKDNYVTFSDLNQNFSKIKSNWDVVYDSDYYGNEWKLSIPAYSSVYIIKNILPDNTILIDDASSLPTSNVSNINYSILDDLNNVVFTSSSGSLKIKQRGRVSLSGTVSSNGNNFTLTDIKKLIQNTPSNYYLLYNNSNKYQFDNFVNGSDTEFYIKNWNLGNVSLSGTHQLLHKVVSDTRGYFNYSGIKLTTSINYETNLNIQNGENADTLYPAIDYSGISYTEQLNNNSFKENYLILIDNDYYIIKKIDGNDIWIEGPEKELTLAGDSLNIDILKYSKTPVFIEEREYPPTYALNADSLDRNGVNMISMSEIDVSSLTLTVLNAKDDQIIETVNQNEGINFQITNLNGEIIQGNI